MSDNATSTDVAAIKAAGTAPIGLALMDGNLPPDLAREMESDLSDVGQAINEAMGLSAGRQDAGTDPKAQPDSQRVPDQAEEAKQQQAPPAPGSLAILIGSIGQRIQRKRAQNMSLAVQTMFRATVAYESSAKAYNDLARARAPGLYRDVADMARKTGQTERQVLANAMNTAIKDPALEPIRASMKRIAEDPEMVNRRREIHEIARRFEDRADQFGRSLAKLDVGSNPDRATQVGDAANRLRAVVDTKLGERVAKLPELDAQVPSLKPDAPLGRFKSGMEDLAKKMEELMQRINNFISSVFGRK